MGKKILIYSLSTCGHCKACKSFFSSNNVEYDYVDVDRLQGEQRSEVLAEVREHNPSLSFPTIIIDGKVFVGFRENELREELGL